MGNCSPEKEIMVSVNDCWKYTVDKYGDQLEELGAEIDHKNKDIIFPVTVDQLPLDDWREITTHIAPTDNYRMEGRIMEELEKQVNITPYSFQVSFRKWLNNRNKNLEKITVEILSVAEGLAFCRTYAPVFLKLWKDKRGKMERDEDTLYLPGMYLRGESYCSILKLYKDLLLHFYDNANTMLAGVVKN